MLRFVTITTNMARSKVRQSFLLLALLSTLMVCGIYFTEDQDSERERICRQPQRHQEKQPSYILVVTHTRSGSTLTGDIIQQVDNSFYAFEPLRFISEDAEQEKSILFLNGTQRNYQYLEDIVQLQADILHRWFTCDFCHVNIQDLQSQFIGDFSKNLKGYADCLNYYWRNKVQKCVHILKETCYNARLRAIKTVRLYDFKIVELLLEWLPSLKVIYLVRDPRGKLASQADHDPSEWSIVSQQAQTLCSKIMTGINMMLTIQERYSERLKILIYERLAAEPIATSKRLLNLIDMPYTKNIDLVVKQLTHSPLDKTACYWCTKITNSKITSIRWRERISFENAKNIDQWCTAVYEKLGYFRIKNESHLRNTSISLVGNSEIANGLL